MLFGHTFRERERKLFAEEFYLKPGKLLAKTQIK